MPDPAGVVRVTCTSGPQTIIENGQLLTRQVKVTASAAGLVWTATGQVLDSVPQTFPQDENGVPTSPASLTPGAEVTVSLIPTDLSGWSVGGVPVDVSGGKQSHYYTVDILDYMPGVTRPVRTYRADRVTIPSDSGTIDLDLVIPYSGTTGQVTIPANVIAAAVDNRLMINPSSTVGLSDGTFIFRT